MKRLLLARHAKSSWSNPSLSDKERPLNNRGRAAAPRVAQALAELGLVPDVVLSSTSVRTRETWDGMVDHLGSADVRFDDELYLASPGELLSAVSEVEGQAETVMTLAHNPGTHALAVALSRSGDTELLLALRGKFPTGAVAVIEFDIDTWDQIGVGGTLAEFIQPRLLD